MAEWLIEPDRAQVRAVASRFELRIAELNKSAALDERSSTLLQSTVLHSAFPAFLWYRRGQLEQASRWIEASWELHASSFGAPSPSEGGTRPQAGGLEPDERDLEFLPLWNLVVSELDATRMACSGPGYSRRACLTVRRSEFGRIMPPCWF
ncbi:MAG: hypothetical protein AAB225_17015, partial [Acidobacteriota bacterium]